MKLLVLLLQTVLTHNDIRQFYFKFYFKGQISKKHKHTQYIVQTNAHITASIKLLFWIFLAFSITFLKILLFLVFAEHKLLGSTWEGRPKSKTGL